MTTGELFVLFMSACVICAIAGFKLGARHFRRLFELMTREPPRERPIDLLEDPAADRDERSN